MNCLELGFIFFVLQNNFFDKKISCDKFKTENNYFECSFFFNRNIGKNGV